MSNKNLLLPNYFIQSSINYIINITENIHLKPWIVELLSVCLMCKSFGVQNPRLVKSYIVQLYSIANGSLPL